MDKQTNYDDETLETNDKQSRYKIIINDGSGREGAEACNFFCKIFHNSKLFSLHDNYLFKRDESSNEP